MISRKPKLQRQRKLFKHKGNILILFINLFVTLLISICVIIIILDYIKEKINNHSLKI